MSDATRRPLDSPYWVCAHVRDTVTHEGVRTDLGQLERVLQAKRREAGTLTQGTLREGAPR